MKILKFLCQNILAPVIGPFIGTIVLASLSKIKTGKWLELFKRLPKIWWLILIIIIFMWAILILVLKRVKRLKELNYYPAFSISKSTPVGGWKDIGKIPYKGVIWKVQVPAIPRPWSIDNLKDEINIETPPRCPHCRTELEETVSFFGGYKWKCVNCNFKKRNKDSFSKESKRVLKIALREIEKENGN